MAAHIVHHSSDNFNLGTAVRNGWFTIFINLSLCLDSNHWFPPEMLVVCIEALWQFQLHTHVKKLGFREILNTHTMHQVHHAQNIEYMDKTMVVFLMFLIEFFGT
jgi:sterol desaturase/sphingolipid hydroxylase (fatty acid hydroxylase superfamily)